MTLAAFGAESSSSARRFFFFAVSFAFGGGVLALQLLQGRPLSVSGGLLYAPAGLPVLLFSGAICYGLFLLVFGRLARHGGLKARPRARRSHRGGPPGRSSPPCWTRETP
jgi:stage II sporulation protein GA (sporulation sigma-E factor processing peptidase)